MPRYYFDVYENGVAERDGDGVELPDVEAARHEAIAAIKDAVLDEVVSEGLADISTAFIEVRDETGLVTVKVTYAEALGLQRPPNRT